MDRSTPEDDLGQATFRELIVQLALAEDERRKTSNPERIAALNRREQAIAAALHNHGPGPAGSIALESPAAIRRAAR